MQQRLQEGHVVRCRGVEAAAAGPELRREWRLERLRCQRPVRLPLVYGHLARPLLRRRGEAGVLHAERGEDVFTKIDVELLAAGRLNEQPDPVEVHAVLPALA